MFNLVLVEPEIPPNTVNIARLALAIFAVHFASDLVKSRCYEASISMCRREKRFFFAVSPERVRQRCCTRWPDWKDQRPERSFSRATNCIAGARPKMRES